MRELPKSIRPYSLRTLFLAVALAALPFAGIRHQYDRVTSEARAAYELERRGVAVGCNYQGHSAKGIPWSSTPLPGPAWLRACFGADFFASPVEMVVQSRPQFSAEHYATFTDAHLALLAQLPKLRVLNLDDCDVADASVPRIAAQNGLELLSIRDTRISDAGIAHLRRSLPRCEIRCER